MEVGGGGLSQGAEWGKEGGVGDWKERGALTYGESTRRSNHNPNQD